MQHCCFSAAGSRFRIYSYIRQLPLLKLTMKYLPFFVGVGVVIVVVIFKIKTRDSLILIIFHLCSHLTYASDPTHISSSHSLFSSSMSKTLKGERCC